MIVLEKDQEKLAMEELEKVLRMEIEKKYKGNLNEMAQVILTLSKYVLILGGLSGAYMVGVDFSDAEKERHTKVLTQIMSEMGVNNIAEIPSQIENIVTKQKESELLMMDTIGGIC
jgi:hypothetical protein